MRDWPIGAGRVRLVPASNHPPRENPSTFSNTPSTPSPDLHGTNHRNNPSQRNTDSNPTSPTIRRAPLGNDIVPPIPETTPRPCTLPSPQPTPSLFPTRKLGGPNSATSILARILAMSASTSTPTHPSTPSPQHALSPHQGPAPKPFISTGQRLRSVPSLAGGA